VPGYLKESHLSKTAAYSTEAYFTNRYPDSKAEHGIFAAQMWGFTDPTVTPFAPQQTNPASLLPAREEG